MKSASTIKNFSFLEQRPDKNRLNIICTNNEEYDIHLSHIQYYNASLSYLLDIFEDGYVSEPYVLFINDINISKELCQRIIAAQKEQLQQLEKGSLKELFTQFFVNYTLYAQKAGKLTTIERSSAWDNIGLNTLSSDNKMSIHHLMKVLNVEKTAIEELIVDTDDFFDLFNSQAHLSEEPIFMQG